jgi:hypothetical protein
MWRMNIANEPNDNMNKIQFIQINHKGQIGAE